MTENTLPQLMLLYLYIIILSSEGENYITFLLLLIWIFNVITNINVNASPAEAPPADESRTEDGRWTEDDYEGSLEEQEEQAQEDLLLRKAAVGEYIAINPKFHKLVTSLMTAVDNEGSLDK